MIYFKIKQKFTIKQLIFSIQKHFRICTIILALLLSSSIFLVETFDHSYFSDLRNKVLSSAITTKIIMAPANIVHFIFNKASSYFAEKHDTSKLSNAISPIEFNALQQENYQLRKLLKFTQGYDYTVITTNIIWQIRNKSSHYGIINIGTTHGIHNGQAVVNEWGLVGKIINAHENRAEILFIDSDDFRAAIAIGENGDKAILAGSYSEKKLRIQYLEQLSSLTANEYVTTTGDFPNFKGGIFIGTFSAPDVVITDINWTNLKYVSVVIP